MIRWSFSTSPTLMALGAALWLVAAVLCFLQWQQRGRGKIVFALESARMFVITALCIALMKPEMVREIAHTDPPQVVVLMDGSGSMKTRDVTLDEGAVATRGDWLEKKRDVKFWAALETKGKVAVEDFAKPLPPEQTPGAAADEGTDINDALDKVAARPGNLKAVMLLTDGDWNLGKSPVTAATKLRAR